MAAKINRTGKTYGDLTVLETILGSNSKKDTYLVKCNCCGNTMIIGIDALLKGLKCKNCRNKDRKSTYQDMLIAFANEHFESMNNGKMQLKCWVDKNVVGAYTFEEFKKNGGHIRQLKQSSRGKYVTDESDFVDTDKSFADVFPNMEKGKLYYVDGETYYIGEVVTGAN